MGLPGSTWRILEILLELPVLYILEERVKEPDLTFIYPSREVEGIARSKIYLPTSKRPVRLLPPRILFGDRNNETLEPAIPRFYGPSANCSELFLLLG